MQALRTSAASSVRRGATKQSRPLVQQRFQSNPPQPEGKTAPAPGAQQRSSFIAPAAAIVAVVGGVLLYNTRQTGQPDAIGKAMAKSGTPSQRSGGLGKMEIEDPNKRLAMGGTEEEPEMSRGTPPTTRPKGSK